MRVESPSLADARAAIAGAPEPPAPTEPIEVYVGGEIVYSGDVAGLLLTEAP